MCIVGSCVGVSTYIFIYAAYSISARKWSMNFLFFKKLKFILVQENAKQKQKKQPTNGHRKTKSKLLRNVNLT